MLLSSIPHELLSAHLLPMLDLATYSRLCAVGPAMWRRRASMYHHAAPACEWGYRRKRLLRSICMDGDRDRMHREQSWMRPRDQSWFVQWPGGSASMITADGRVTEFDVSHHSIHSRICYDRVRHVTSGWGLHLVLTRNTLFVHSRSSQFRQDTRDDDFDDLSGIVCRGSCMFDMTVSFDDTVVVRQGTAHGDLYQTYRLRDGRWSIVDVARTPEAVDTNGWGPHWSAAFMGTFVMASAASHRPTLTMLCGCGTVSLRSRICHMYSLLGGSAVLVLCHDGSGVVLREIVGTKHWRVLPVSTPGRPSGVVVIGCCLDDMVVLRCLDDALTLDLNRGGPARRCSPGRYATRLSASKRMCLSHWPDGEVMRHW